MNFYKIKHSIARRLYPLLHKCGFASIGKKSFIYKPIMLNNTQCMHLGNYVEILNGARIECITHWNDTHFTPSLIIGDRTIINQNCHITCGRLVKIGAGVGVSNNVTITDISHSFSKRNVDVVNQPIMTKDVTIGDGTTIGANCVILPGVEIGQHCVIGANSVVCKSIPDYSVAVGSPAKVIKHIDD